MLKLASHRSVDPRRIDALFIAGAALALYCIELRLFFYAVPIWSWSATSESNVFVALTPLKVFTTNPTLEAPDPL